MDIVIVGAGQAGGWVARTLRSCGFEGTITLIGEERHAPYERPPLSKGILNGQETELSYVIDQTAMAELGITFVPGKTVARIDRDARTVHCSDGSTYPYTKLVLATGGRPRPLTFPTAHLRGVHTLRTVDDARQIAASLQPGKRLIVIGGGWIGLEVAATARQKGMEVTVVEAAGCLCGRTLPAEISAFLLEEHRRYGVNILLSCSVRAMRQNDNGGITADIDGLSEGVTADVVLVGIGLLPNIELAQTTGLSISNGIDVDEQGGTSDEHIYAAGDVTCFSSEWGGDRLRLESWANAQNQGIAVGQALAGEAVNYDEIPWFWSDQYDIQLQMIGLVRPGTQKVVRGSMAQRKFTLFELTGSRITAAIAINMPRDVRHAKRLMKAGTLVCPADLADPGVRLEKL